MHINCEEKLKNLKNSTHCKIKFHIIFIYIFFSMIDIKKFPNGVGLCYPFRIFFFLFFFFTLDIKIYTYGGARRWAWGRQVALSIQKNKKNHKNSTNSKIKFNIIFFFLQWILKIFYRGKAWGQIEFFFLTLLYYFINVMIKTVYISNFIVV